MARTLSLVAVVSVVALAAVASTTARRSGDAEGKEFAVTNPAVLTGSDLSQGPQWRGAPGRDLETNPAAETIDPSNESCLLVDPPVPGDPAQATVGRSGSSERPPAGRSYASAASAPVGDTGSSEPSPSADGTSVPTDRGQADAQDRPSTPTPEIAGCVLLALGGAPYLFRRNRPD